MPIRSLGAMTTVTAANIPAPCFVAMTVEHVPAEQILSFVRRPMAFTVVTMMDPVRGRATSPIVQTEIRNPRFVAALISLTRNSLSTVEPPCLDYLLIPFIFHWPHSIRVGSVQVLSV
jgi:hypothetical protein